MNDRSPPEAGAGEDGTSADEMDGLIRAQNALGFSLLRVLGRRDAGEPGSRTEAGSAPGEGGGNLLLSPPGLTACLAVLHAGASGETRQELARALGLEDAGESYPWAEVKEALGAYASASDRLREETVALQPRVDRVPDPVLLAGASLWLAPGIALADGFADLAYREFAAEVEQVDLADPRDRKKLDRWARDWTDGHLDEVADESMAGADLVALTAFYFEAAWRSPFGTEFTTPDTFHRADGTEVEVPFMRQEGDWEYWTGDGAEVVRLPYQGSRGPGEVRYAFYAVLPDPGEGLGSLLDRVDGETWRGWRDAVEERTGTVALPRVEARTDADLVDLLTEHGLEAPFRPGEARFDRMLSGGGGQWVGRLRQTAFLSVDERGTAAGAITTAHLEAELMPAAEPFEFVADRPFLAVLADERSGGILLLAAVHDPGT